ncbi:MAG: anthranilate synthase component II [Thermoanaerobaculaceae bacterium]
MILMVDNYDSFTYNLVQYLWELVGEREVKVVRNDALSVAEMLALKPEVIVISPGPGRPETAGVCVELLQKAASVPVLGVCLGHQALGVAYGARVVRAPQPVHGKTSAIYHQGAGIFRSLPNPFVATRYHSLVVDRESLPPHLEVTAWTEDGLIMGLRHRERPHMGVQFHPESYLTQEGKAMLRNFLEGVSQ